MDKTKSLESLPPEILIYITSFLSIKDILSCCATSSFLRYVFNDDMVWRRHCNARLISYLKLSERNVEPDYEWLEDRHSSLSPVSNWRESYMLQKQLFANWRNGSYDKKVIEFGPKNGIFIHTEALFFQNDYLFLHVEDVREQKNINEIWDVQETPFLHSTINYTFTGNDTCITMFEIAGSKLIMAQYNLVWIYSISLSSYSSIPIVNAFVFNWTEKECNDIRLSSLRGIIKNSDVNIVNHIESIICDKYFIGILTSIGSLDTPVFHIWDVEVGNKVKEEYLPIKYERLTNIKLLNSLDEPHILIKLTVSKDRFTYHYYGYSVTKREFSSFLVKHNYCDFLCLKHDYAIGVGQNTLFIFDYQTAEKKLEKKCNHQILKKTLTVVGNNVLFGTFDSIVHVIDLYTLDVINKVRLGFTLYSLQSICDKFVVINSAKSEVWEIGTGAKVLFQFPVDHSLASINETNTKISVAQNNKLIILNFW